jgi:long-chain acyl-CoA synthetase
MTETSPVIALNNDQHCRVGAVGQVLPNMDVRLAEDGELEVHGSAVFSGYWNKPEQTAESFTPDGWFMTGDVARIDEDGFLYITDRKKELLKTSGGKMIAPQPIENKLKVSLLVAQVALIGDRHKFISALISPNFVALEDWAKRHGIHAKSRAELVADSRVIARYAEIVREVNGSLANFETLKRFRVVADEWSIETGELTPSMKLKRRVITAQYAEAIAELYADEATSRGE